MVVLDQDSRGQVDAVIGSSAAKHRILFESPHTGDGFARVEHVGMGSLDCVGVFTRQRRDATQVLHQVENHALAT